PAARRQLAQIARRPLQRRGEAVSAPPVVLAEGYTPPGQHDFEFPPLFGEGTFLTKPMLIIILGSVFVAVFLYLAARRAAVVPGKLQYAGEQMYGFVRNGIARDSIGHGYRKFVPWLATLFFFLLVLNLSAIIPILQFPA